MDLQVRFSPPRTTDVLPFLYGSPAEGARPVPSYDNDIGKERVLHLRYLTHRVVRIKMKTECGGISILTRIKYLMLIAKAEKAERDDTKNENEK